MEFYSKGVTPVDTGESAGESDGETELSAGMVDVLNHVVYISHSLEIRLDYFWREASGVSGCRYNATVP